MPLRAVGVADVDDLQPVEDLESEVEVEGAGFVGVGAQRSGAESGSGPVGGAEVERGAENGDVGLPVGELLEFGDQRSLGEGEDTAEDVPEVELLAQARVRRRRRGVVMV